MPVALSYVIASGPCVYGSVRQEIPLPLRKVGLLNSCCTQTVCTIHLLLLRHQAVFHTPGNIVYPTGLVSLSDFSSLPFFSHSTSP